MNEHQRAGRAAIFRGALEDGVIGETLTEIETRLVDEWKRTLDERERDNLWRSVHILNLLRQNLGVIAAGDTVTALRRAK